MNTFNIKYSLLVFNRAYKYPYFYKIIKLLSTYFIYFIIFF